MCRRIGVLLVVLSVLPAAPALGTEQVNEFDMSLYGRWWHVLTYYVEEDLSDTTFLEPEGLAFADDVLYVSGDRGIYETDSRLAMYDTSGGTLTFTGYLQMTLSPDGWGPEGLVFNPSGSGYGNGPDQLVSVERDDTGQAGVIDLGTGSVTDLLATSIPEDVAYLSAAGSFATLQDSGGPVTVAFHDDSFVPTGSTITVAPATNGLVAITSTFASFLTRGTVTNETLLTVTKVNPGNAINVYDLNGVAIRPQRDLPVEPKARIPLGGGFFLEKPAFGTVEAITVDESEPSKTIYIGDEGNAMVHVLTPGSLVGDFLDDGDVDQDDWDQFVYVCFTGPGGGPIDPSCVPADADVDDDIDCDDWEQFTLAWTGPPDDIPDFEQCSGPRSPPSPNGE